MALCKITAWDVKAASASPREPISLDEPICHQKAIISKMEENVESPDIAWDSLITYKLQIETETDLLEILKCVNQIQVGKSV